MTLSCTASAKQFSAQGQGLLRFLSENRCLAGDDLYLGKFKDDSMPISRSHKRAVAECDFPLIGKSK